jgi:hypothetical protein
MLASETNTVTIYSARAARLRDVVRYAGRNVAAPVAAVGSFFLGARARGAGRTWLVISTNRGFGAVLARLEGGGIGKDRGWSSISSALLDSS